MTQQTLKYILGKFKNQKQIAQYLENPMIRERLNRTNWNTIMIHAAQLPKQ